MGFEAGESRFESDGKRWENRCLKICRVPKTAGSWIGNEWVWQERGVSSPGGRRGSKQAWRVSAEGYYTPGLAAVRLLLLRWIETRDIPWGLDSESVQQTQPRCVNRSKQHQKLPNSRPFHESIVYQSASMAFHSRTRTQKKKRHSIRWQVSTFRCRPSVI